LGILIRARKRVWAKKRSPGIDEITVDDLSGYLKKNWPRIREGVMTGEFRPQPVKEVLIPKPDGNDRRLGIPAAMDMNIERFFDRVNMTFLWDDWAER
jgi:RNA-directed DNA polymerase